MRHRLVSVKIGNHSLTVVRERTRQVGELFGLETLQRTRLVTAVSEIARNTAQYAGEGMLTFMFDTQSLHCRGQSLVAEIADQGPGIPNLQLVSQGMHRSREASGVTGIVGARRLVDHMVLRTPDSFNLRARLPPCADDGQHGCVLVRQIFCSDTTRCTRAHRAHGKHLHDSHQRTIRLPIQAKHAPCVAPKNGGAGDFDAVVAAI